MAQLRVNPADLLGDANVQDFVMRQFLARHVFITLAVVVAAHDGVLDVRPMVHAVTGRGTPIDNEIIYNVPVWRLQRGNSAVKMDPVAGDIGLIAICDEDISVVKRTRQPALPGSARTHNFSDAIYLGGVLNGQPTQYVEFADNQINVVSPGKIRLHASDIEAEAGNSISLKAAKILLDGEVAASEGLSVAGKSSLAGGAKINEIEFDEHLHGGVQSGGSKTGKPQ